MPKIGQGGVGLALLDKLCSLGCGGGTFQSSKPSQHNVHLAVQLWRCNSAGSIQQARQAPCVHCPCHSPVRPMFPESNPIMPCLNFQPLHPTALHPIHCQRSRSESLRLSSYSAGLFRLFPSKIPHVTWRLCEKHREHAHSTRSSSLHCNDAACSTSPFHLSANKHGHILCYVI